MKKVAKKWLRRTAQKILSALEEKPKHWDEMSFVIVEEHCDHNEHANYIVRQDFFYEAFYAFMKKRGVSHEELLDEFGKLIFLRYEEGHHFGELLLGDEIAVRTGIAEIGRTSITVFQNFIKGSRVVKSTKAVLVLVNAHNRKPSAIPEKVRERVLAP